MKKHSGHAGDFLRYGKDFVFHGFIVRHAIYARMECFPTTRPLPRGGTHLTSKLAHYKKFSPATDTFPRLLALCIDKTKWRPLKTDKREGLGCKS